MEERISDWVGFKFFLLFCVGCLLIILAVGVVGVPVQNNTLGFWTDNFSDGTGINRSTNITNSTRNVSISLNVGRGRDGSLTVTGTNFTDRVRANLTANSNAGDSFVTLNSTVNFNVNDEVLLVQMIGGLVGIWETKHVKNISGGQITFTEGLMFNYSVAGSGRAQAVRVMEFVNLTINSGGVLTVSTFDGSTGGVMYIRVNESLTVNSGGVVNVTGRGYRNGSGGVGGLGGAGADFGVGGANGVTNGMNGTNGSFQNVTCSLCGGNGGAREGNAGNGSRGGDDGFNGSLGSSGSSSGDPGGGGNGSGGSNPTPSLLDRILMGGGGGGGNAGNGGQGGGGGGGGGGGQGGASVSGQNGTVGGSGGDGGNGGEGGRGGGIIKIVSSVLVVNGFVIANGSDGSAGVGGGTGSSGGAGGAGGAGGNDGGGGGGGRGAGGGVGGGAGGGGGGGLVILQSNNLSIGTSRVQAGKGNSGARGGSGTAGAGGGGGAAGGAGAGGGSAGQSGFAGNNGSVALDAGDGFVAFSTILTTGSSSPVSLNVSSEVSIFGNLTSVTIFPALGQIKGWLRFNANYTVYGNGSVNFRIINDTSNLTLVDNLNGLNNDVSGLIPYFATVRLEADLVSSSLQRSPELHFWNVTWDVNSVIVTSLVGPGGDFNTHDYTPNFYYNFTDSGVSSGLEQANCSLQIDGVNNTNHSGLTGSNESLNITITPPNPLSILTHNWTVSCTDGFSNSTPSNRTILVLNNDGELKDDWSLAAMLALVLFTTFFGYVAFNLKVQQGVVRTFFVMMVFGTLLIVVGILSLITLQFSMGATLSTLTDTAWYVMVPILFFVMFYFFIHHFFGVFKNGKKGNDKTDD